MTTTQLSTSDTSSTADYPVKSTAWAGYTMVAISILHLIYFGIKSATFAGGWIGGDLRGTDRLGHGMTETAGYFWASIGSFAVPLLAIGLWLIMAARQRAAVPRSLPWLLGAWVVICVVLMEPSGFPLGLIPAGLLLFARSRAH